MQKIQFKLNNRVVTVGSVNPVSFIYRLGRISFLSMLILLPLAFLNKTTVYNDDLAFGLYAASVLFGVGCLISLLFYKGKNVLIDPISFVNVLIFALLVITPTVISTPSSSANTFGVIGLRSISGLAIILFVIAFYLINVFNLKDRIWNLFPKVTSVINIAILFALLLTGIYSNASFISTLNLLVLYSVINFVLSLRINNQRVNILNVVTLTFTYFLTYRAISSEFKVAISLLFAAVFYFLILRIIKRVGMDNLKTEFQKNMKFEVYTVGLAVSVVTLLLTVLSSGFNSFGSVTKIFNYFTNFGTIDGNVIAQILFGRGLLSSAASGNSSLYVIISSFGLVALIGFLYLFFYVLRRELRAKNIINVLVLLLIGIGSVFVNLGVYINIVFLFILIQSSGFNPFTLNTDVQTKNRAVRILRKVGVAFVMMVTIIVIINLLKLLRILI